jgi:phosphoprotein serine/threonine phosphatase
MGGHYGGAKAASVTLDAFETYFNNNFPENIDYKDKKTINA